MCSKPVKLFREVMPAADVFNTLLHTTHNGFPVITSAVRASVSFPTRPWCFHFCFCFCCPGFSFRHLACDILSSGL